MYYKKYLVVNNMKSLGSLGLVYLFCNGKSTRIKLAVNTVGAPKGDLWIALLLDGKLFVREIQGRNSEFELECASLSHAECLIAVKSERLEPLAYASDGISDSGALLVMLKNALNSPLIPDEQMDTAFFKDGAADYESFVAQTENYFEGQDIVPDVPNLDEEERLRSIEEYSEAFKRYYETERGGNYYLSVKEQLQNLFDSFPAVPELIEQFENSYWIKISKKNKYFALGILTDDGAPSYICYALPADGNNADPDFSLTTLKNGQKYYVLYQDTTDGSVKTKQAVS